jgi:hypothetical protein
MEILYQLKVLKFNILRIRKKNLIIRRIVRIKNRVINKLEKYKIIIKN